MISRAKSDKNFPEFKRKELVRSAFRSRLRLKTTKTYLESMCRAYSRPDGNLGLKKNYTPTALVAAQDCKADQIGKLNLYEIHNRTKYKRHGPSLQPEYKLYSISPLITPKTTPSLSATPSVRKFFQNPETNGTKKIIPQAPRPAEDSHSKPIKKKNKKDLSFELKGWD
jgi:hypothetical protein